MEPLRVVVRRGAVVEAVHVVHAVAVEDGRVVAFAGDAELVTFMRSSAKPLQALPLARAREDMDERDLAIASASHRAQPDQLEAVRALLTKADATEDDLECGVEQGSRLRHNCSGKHAGMLALARTRGWPARGYRLAGHPVQEGCLAEVAAAAEVSAADMATAVDGCGVVTFALTLKRMAHAFSRLESLDAGPRVATAMRAHPELIRGGDAADTLLMKAFPGWTAKGGAEGLLCAVGPDRVGVALKVADGSGRGVRPALGSFLARLGLDRQALERAGLGRLPLLNSRDEECGEIVTAL
ncbi:MAG TPA: asparaginase [Gaiellaceae bacterium]|nr:asparaginase [Gaiellaceae bacterium]